MNCDQFLEKYADEKGNVRLYDKEIFVLPDNLTVLGDLDLHESNIRKLPKNLTVHGHLILRYMKLKELPMGLTVHGTLDLRNTKIKKIPKDIKILGTLDLRRAKIKFPSEELNIGQGLNLFMNKKIKELPKNLYVGGKCELFGTEIFVLPEKLIVGETLSLSGNYIDKLPKKLLVKGNLFVDGKLIFNSAHIDTYSSYVLPSTELLGSIPEKKKLPDEITLQKEVDTLLTVLSKLGIEAKVNEIVYGPMVTLFKVYSTHEELESMSNEYYIGGAMERASVRIQALGNEKNTYEIEIPNKERMPISIRELLESVEFQNDTSPLTFAIGQNVIGEIVTMNLADVSPLVVGNAYCGDKYKLSMSLVFSILYKAKPDEFKLLLFDGECTIFSDFYEIPHLLSPIEDWSYIEKFNWLIDEIDRRLQIFEALKVEDLDSYNIKVKEFVSNDISEENQVLSKKLPYILIIFEDILGCIQHTDILDNLTVSLREHGQKVGIYIVMFSTAAVRVTKIMRENCSGKISCKADRIWNSGFISDAKRVSKLGRRNDMLYESRDGSITRLHSAQIECDESEKRVANFCKKQAKPVYIGLSAYEVEEDYKIDEVEEDYKIDDNVGNFFKSFFNKYIAKFMRKM